ncbi:MAG: hypothetical protein E6R03_08635 [Hyphomicrobiaceae bacterium]|nr:MAG: hypothetical protein E6R03_08635 [Hyphomicrobiaceae bacterium]
MITLDFKRGDTFLLQAVGTVDDVGQDMTNWSVAAQVRNGSSLLHNLTLTWVDRPNGIYQLSCAPVNTATWPVKLLVCDIQYTTASGQVISTETFGINNIADVTQ